MNLNFFKVDLEPTNVFLVQGVARWLLCSGVSLTALKSVGVYYGVAASDVRAIVLDEKLSRFGSGRHLHRFRGIR
jgi:uncharacterized protein YunC (DUF1805 family)